jgi:hypothetical protein
MKSIYKAVIFIGMMEGRGDTKRFNYLGYRVGYTFDQSRNTSK